jgi:predicted nucleic acid-binding protein
VLRALDLYATTRLDVGDALLIAAMEEGAVDLHSYDRHFDRIPGITRREP